MLTLEPTGVARRRDLLVIDIRPAVERHAALGFIPASLALPLTGVPAEEARTALADLGARAGGGDVVLYCTSGRRSAEVCQALGMPRVANLAGGLLGWEAAGLPICRITTVPAGHPASVLEYRRHLVACFVGENTEVALDQAANAEPWPLLQSCFDRAGVPFDAPTVEGLYRVLDWAGLSTFRAGGDLRRIAANLVEMHGMLRALELATV
jgi:rhodanese-related sulfurtransferase